MKNQVITLAQQSYEPQQVQEKLDRILTTITGGETLKDKKVLIKPNCGPLATEEEALTVHPVVLKMLIKVLKEKQVKRIIVAESSYINNDTREAFEKAGLAKVIREDGFAEFVDLKTCQYQSKLVQGLVIKQIALPELLTEVDLVISLAKLKTNLSATVSLTIKNLKGLLEDTVKRKFHLTDLARSVHDLYVSMPGNVIGIIDGIVGSEFYQPKQVGLLAGGNNLLALDIHCARLMGFEIDQIPHLKLFDEPGYELISDLDSIPQFNTQPINLAQVEQKYRITISGQGTCSNCLGALVLALQKADKRNIAVTDLNIIIGRSKESCEGERGNPSCARDVYIGNCAKPQSGNNSFVAGCPPLSGEILNCIGKPRQ